MWGVRIWHPLIFERQILKQTLKWATPPHLSPLSLAAEIWNIKDTESPSAFKRTAKCSTFLVRFLKWSHLKAICLHWNLTCHCYRELSLHGASADGDRHPSPAAFTKTNTWCLAGLPNGVFHLRSAETCSNRATSAFTYSCYFQVKKIPEVIKE